MLLLLLSSSLLLVVATLAGWQLGSARSAAWLVALLADSWVSE